MDAVEDFVVEADRHLVAAGANHDGPVAAHEPPIGVAVAPSPALPTRSWRAAVSAAAPQSRAPSSTPPSCSTSTASRSSWMTASRPGRAVTRPVSRARAIRPKSACRSDASTLAPARDHAQGAGSRHVGHRPVPLRRAGHRSRPVAGVPRGEHRRGVQARVGEGGGHDCLNRCGRHPCQSRALRLHRVRWPEANQVCCHSRAHKPNPAHILRADPGAIGDLHIAHTGAAGYAVPDLAHPAAVRAIIVTFV